MARYQTTGKRMLSMIVSLGLLFLTGGCSQEERTGTQEDDSPQVSSPLEERETGEQTVLPEEDKGVLWLTESCDSLPLYQGTRKDAYPASLVSRYYGCCRTTDTFSLLNYDIRLLYHRPSPPERLSGWYEYCLTFCDYATDIVVQELSYEAEWFGDAESIRQGLTILDVNQDGSEDILLDMGLRGKCYTSVCFVYVPEEGYVEVEGFDDIPTPWYDAERGSFWGELAGENGLREYKVVGTELLRLDTLGT